MSKSYQLIIFDWNGTLSNAVEAFLHGFNDDKVAPLYEGVETVLKQLVQAGKYCAIATGQSRRSLDRELIELGIADYFVATRCAGECMPKPDPEMLQDIMVDLQCSPEQTLMVGDTVGDMLAAHHAGVDALAVSYGLESEQTLLRHQPIGCIADIQGLCQYLDLDARH